MTRHQPYPPTSFYDRLTELSKLEDGWLDRAGKKPSAKALREASILGPCLPADAALHVYPTEAGGVALEWKDEHGGHEIEVHPDGHLFLMSVEPDASSELTADEARAEVERLGAELYFAQDAHAFVGEMCDLFERKQETPEGYATLLTSDVREWLKGPRCIRLVAVDGSTVPDRGEADGTAGVLEALRVHVRNTLETSGRSQASIARELKVSTKHLNQMLQGRSPLTLEWADRIVRACGMRIVVGEAGQ